MFYEHTLGRRDVVLNMLRTQEILMPVVWDVLPICTIYYLHQCNISPKVDFDINLTSAERSTNGTSECS